MTTAPATVLSIDPGDKESAWLLYDIAQKKPLAFDKVPNTELLRLLHRTALDGKSGGHLAIEMIASYGMPVGREVFETCVWIGRFITAWGDTAFDFVYRKNVKLHVCGTLKAKDSNVRQAMLDRYGGKESAIGKKKTPGPLYGISKDVWSALAIALTWSEATQNAAERKVA